MSIDHNDQAAALLSRCGFHCEPEPGWLTGKRPDFLCTGPAEFWAEVKSLDQPNEVEASTRFLQWARERTHQVRNPGTAHAVVSDDADEKDVRVAFAILDDVLARPREQNVCDEIVLIPLDPDYGNYARVDVKLINGMILTLHCCRSVSGRYGQSLYGINDIEWREIATVTSRIDGSSQRITAGDLGLHDSDGFRLALHVRRIERQFFVRSVARAGMGYSLTNVEKIRNDARYANSQFKSACRQRKCPCLLMFLQDRVWASPPVSFVSAFYGDHQIAWRLGKETEQPPETFGRDGVWYGGKNSTTSAACYLRSDEPLILVHNYWATRRLPEGLLGGVEYKPLDDGSFQITKFSTPSAISR